MRAWIGGIAAVVLLAWFWILSALPFLPSDPTRKEGVSRFVPSSRQPADRVMAGEPGRIASREAAHFEGLAISGEFPKKALYRIQPPKGGLGLDWWRETVSPTSPDGVPRSEQTLRWVDTDQGIGLTLRSGRESVAFQPALLELPADPRPGSRWSSSGELSDREGTAPYHNESSAVVAPMSADADRGCLEVTSVTSVRGRDRRDVATWCPGVGVLRGTPTMGERVQPLLITWPAQRAPRKAPVRPVAGRVEPGRMVTVDPVFGTEEESHSSLKEAPPVTTSGTAVLITQAGGLMAVVHEGGQAVARSWMRPRGQVITVTAMDDVVLASTTERQVVAYGSDGRRLWTTMLDDISPGGAVRTGPDEFVVADLTGEVYARRISDGSLLWRQEVDGGTAVAPTVIAGRIVVQGKDGAITVLGLDGKQLWRNEEPGIDPKGYFGDERSLFAGDLRGNIVRLDADTGKVVGHRLSGYSEGQGRVVSGQSSAAIMIEEGVRLLDRHDGRELGNVADVTDVTPDGEGWWMVTPTEVLRTDRAGVVERRIPLGRTFKKPGIRVTPSRLWVTGESNEELAWIS